MSSSQTWRQSCWVRRSWVAARAPTRWPKRLDKQGPVPQFGGNGLIDDRRDCGEGIFLCGAAIRPSGAAARCSRQPQFRDILEDDTHGDDAAIFFIRIKIDQEILRVVAAGLDRRFNAGDFGPAFKNLCDGQQACVRSGRSQYPSGDVLSSGRWAGRRHRQSAGWL